MCCEMVQVTSVVAVLAEKEGETQGWTSNKETVCIENTVQFVVWGLGSFTRQRNHRCHQATFCKCLMGNVQNPGRQLPFVMEGEGRTGVDWMRCHFDGRRTHASDGLRDDTRSINARSASEDEVIEHTRFWETCMSSSERWYFISLW